MMTDLEFDDLLKRLHKFGMEDGDLGAMYWNRVIKQLREMRAHSTPAQKDKRDDAADQSGARRPDHTTFDSTRRLWRTTMQDAGDGSGDAILTLPDALVAELGWQAGDLLDISRRDADELVLKKAS